MNFNDHIETVEEVELRHQDTLCTNESHLVHPWWYNFKYSIVGIIFGIVLVKAEVINWFRIQEMFHLTSFYMFGVLGTAIIVGALSVFIIKKLNLKSIYGEKISIDNKEFNKGQIYGALIFGLGWGITGGCPGPLFAQFGSGFTVVIVTILSAITGTWIYGYFREKLPH